MDILPITLLISILKDFADIKDICKLFCTSGQRPYLQQCLNHLKTNAVVIPGSRFKLIGENNNNDEPFQPLKSYLRWLLYHSLKVDFVQLIFDPTTAEKTLNNGIMTLCTSLTSLDISRCSDGMSLSVPMRTNWNTTLTHLNVSRHSLDASSVAMRILRNASNLVELNLRECVHFSLGAFQQIAECEICAQPTIVFSS